jgi:hypothetical protein
MNGVGFYVNTNDDINVFDGEALDTFSNENIILQMKQIDIKDIAKNFADYTYDFAVPATPKNMRILRFWHDPINDRQFSRTKKIACRIYIDGAIFRVGYIKILTAKPNQFGEISSYSLKFNSSYVALKDAFGDKKLNELGFVDVLPEGNQFYYYDENVVDLLNVGSDDVLAMPLINVNHLMDDFELWKHGNNGNNGLKAEDLRPALRLKYILKALEKENNSKFFGGFLDSDVYNNLFIWLNRNEFPSSTLQVIGLQGNQYGSGGQYLQFHIDPDVNGNCYGTIQRQSEPDNYNTQKYFEVEGYVGVSNDSIPYKLFIQRVILNEDDTVNEEATATQANSGFVASHSEYVTGGHSITYGLHCDENFNWGEKRHYRLCAEVRGSMTVVSSYLRLSYRILFLNAEYARTYQSDKDIVFLPVFNIVESLPEMPVKDFFESLMKMFNLIVLPVHDLLLQQEYGTQNLYRLEFMKDYYANGKQIDITRYVRRGMPVNDIPTYKKLAFKVPESAFGTNKIYKNVQVPNREYGAMSYDFAGGGDGEYPIESKFNLLIWRYLPKVYEDTFNVYENWLIADSLDDTFEKGVFNKPVIFLYNGHVQVPFGKELNFVHSDDSQSAIYGYPMFSNLDSLDEFDYTTSLCFSQENELKGTKRDKSLYQNHYASLINGIYSPYAREFEVVADLPKIIYASLELSTQFIIGNMKYNITSSDLNLTTGECKMKLNNVIEESNIIEIAEQYIPFNITQLGTQLYNDNIGGFKETNFTVSYPISVWSLKWKAEWTLGNLSYNNSRVSFRTTQSNGTTGLSWFDILEESGTTAGEHETTVNTLTPVGGYQYDNSVAYNSPISCSIRARVGSTLTITFYAYDIYDTEIATQSITVTG